MAKPSARLRPSNPRASRTLRNTKNNTVNTRKKVFKGEEPNDNNPSSTRLNMDIPNQDPSIPILGARNSLSTMPPEIRNEIYELLIPRDEVFLIVSHSKKRTTTNKTALLRVNKLFYQEASPYLYINNEFVFGNGFWGSKTEVNLRGLRDFFARVPVQHRFLITRIRIRIFLNDSLWHSTKEEAAQQHRSSAPGSVLSYNGFRDVDEALGMVKRLKNELTRLETVSLKWLNTQGSAMIPIRCVNLHHLDVWPGSDNLAGSKAILQMLMSVPKLQTIRMDRAQAEFLRRALMDLVEEYPGVDPTLCEEARDVLQSKVRDAGKTIKVYWNICLTHQSTTNRDNWDDKCKFAYREGWLSDTAVLEKSSNV